jgi:DNA-binding MarR family transcriptional regulator
MNSRADAKPFGPPLIGALLRVPWEAVQLHVLTRLHERGYDDFDPSFLAIFRYPGPQGARPTDVAAQLGISKQALNYQLRELERLGYLEREPHPDDLRAKRIVLTPRGTAAIGIIREAVAEVEAVWAERLGARRFEQLRSLLAELNRAGSAAG